MKKIYFYLLATFIVFGIQKGNAQIVDFESVELSENSYNNGSDGKGGMTIGNYRFPNTYTVYEGGVVGWSGFAFSNMTDTVTPGPDNQFSAFAGSGVLNSVNYAVFMSSYTPENNAIYFTEAAEIRGFSITNSTYAALSMMKGDNFAKKFGGESGNDEDFFMLTIEGFDENETSTGKVDFYLADFRFEDNTQDYIVKNWEWVDLTSLGVVKKLTFTLSSSDVGEYGMNTPAYFCMDNFNAEGSTSVDDIAKKTDIQLYPNPIKNNFTIRSNNENIDMIEVMDLSGKIIYTKQVFEKQENISSQNWNSGIYLVRIQIADQLFIKKLIKR